MGFKELFTKKEKKTKRAEEQDAIMDVDVSQALAILQKYKQGKANLEAKIISNEQWYKIRHWGEIKGRTPGDPEPSSAWLFNAIANKHADAMDNTPEPIVLPREASDEKAAQTLTEILPVILEQNDYGQVYSDMWWYKLKTGTGVTGVFWNQKKQNGLGDIDIRTVDLLNLFWEPGVKDIQKSPHFFHVELENNDILKQKYPDIEDVLTSPSIDIGKYIYEDSVDTSEKSAVIDWYYKVDMGGRDVVHYCKFVNGKILYASENDPACAETGFYDHGKYPFVFDTLFPEEGSPCGFGYIDVGKSPQAYIDKLDQCIQKYSVMAANPRFFARGDGAINEEEFADWSKPFVHFNGNATPQDNVIPIQMPILSDIYVTVRQLKVDELKETTGNRDFSQGGTSAGVTAASAIAALQEAGNKLSRDMLKGAYRAFKQIVHLVIELMRQFYEEDRYFRVISGNGQMQFVSFSNADIAMQPQDSDFGHEMGMRLPVFDLDVKVQKSATFATIAENERAKELYSMGFFRPDLADQALAALDMMQFEGIEQVRDRITQNGTMFQQLQMMQARLVQLEQLVGMQSAVLPEPGTPGGGGNFTEGATNALGESFANAQNAMAGAAKTAAIRQAMPR